MSKNLNRVQIVGLSGTHSSGKSTILQAIKEKNLPNLVIDLFSVSRAVQNEFGYTLDQLESDFVLMCRAQERVQELKSIHLGKIKADLSGRDQDYVILTDRTPADFYAYTRTYVEQCRGDLAWLREYEEQCYKQSKYYDQIILVPPHSGTFAEETQRGPQNTQWRNHEYQYHFLASRYPKCHVLESQAVEYRVAEVLRIVEHVVNS